MLPLRDGSAPGCPRPAAAAGTCTLARPLPAARRAPGAGLRSLRSHLARPATKIRERGVRKDSCSPFVKASRASRDAAVGQGDGTLEEVPRETV